MQVLWHFRKDLRCARVIDSDLDTKELSKQVLDLFLLPNEQHAEQDWRTVLLLLDTKEKINDLPIKKVLWEDLIEEIHKRGINMKTPAVIILNCDGKLKMELLPDEKQRFAQKRQEIEKKYKKMSDKFHAFNIMQGGFQKEDAKNLITDEMRKHVENHIKSSSTRLLGFLALINSYVPGSRLMKPLCKEFIEQDRWTDEEKPSLEMKPFKDLMVIFSEGEQKANCIRLAHPLIADACLNMLTEYNLTRSDIAHDFLKNMVKGKESNYDKICKSLLFTRPKGLTEKDMFSRLILDIIKENKTKKCICLLELASKLFSTDPFYPQTLARLYYIKVQGENKYKKAEKWAKEAIDRDRTNSHIRDTLGQVHKNHLSRIWCKIRKEWWKVIKPCTDIDTRLAMAKSAIDAFDDEEKAAKDELANPTAKYNNRGRFGFLQVCKEIYDLIGPENPLKQKHLDFINGLRGSVEDKYDFFEWYLAFSKLSFKEEDPDYFHRDVEDCYKRYFTQDTQNEEKTLNEKKKESFGGLLHFLKSDINVCKQNLSASEKPRSDNEDQIVLYILANTILSLSGEPCEKTEKLQARLRKLWFSKEQGRSPEFYLLIFLLFWPDEAQKAKANPPDLENCVEYMSQSYEREYGEHLRGRYLVPLFFLGTEGGLQRLVHALKPHKKGLRRLVHSKLHQTDLELLTERDESVEVKCPQRINGKVKNQRVFAVRDGQQIPVSAHDRASVCKQGQVSFYLGFNIRGPVAYNIRYHKNCE
uniref:Sterile alpha motif domain-containing protein 9-like n=1 Tax=Sinocyclocheilus rhinocerous TaxID=307959 RepID=A0A673L5Z5_9TELE